MMSRNLNRLKDLSTNPGRLQLVHNDQRASVKLEKSPRKVIGRVPIKLQPQPNGKLKNISISALAGQPAMRIRKVSQTMWNASPSAGSWNSPPPETGNSGGGSGGGCTTECDGLDFFAKSIPPGKYGCTYSEQICQEGIAGGKVIQHKWYKPQCGGSNGGSCYFKCKGGGVKATFPGACGTPSACKGANGWGALNSAYDPWGNVEGWECYVGTKKYQGQCKKKCPPPPPPPPPPKKPPQKPPPPLEPPQPPRRSSGDFGFAGPREPGEGDGEFGGTWGGGGTWGDGGDGKKQSLVGPLPPKPPPLGGGGGWGGGSGPIPPPLQHCLTMGCSKYVICPGLLNTKDVQRCLLQACGKGSCKLCPWKNIVFKGWCSYRCYTGSMITGGAFEFISSIGNYHLGPFCV